MDNMNDKNLIEHEEEILFKVIGDYGPWQRDMFTAIFLINIIVTWQNMAITFLAPNPDFYCNSTTYDSFRAMKYLSKEPEMYNVTQQKINECEFTIEIFPAFNNSHSQKKEILCNQWEYNTSEYSHTIITEWDLVCEREWLVSFARSIYMFGFMAATIVSGQFADRFPTLMVCWVIMCVSGILSAFSTSYCMFCILRFFMAFGGCAVATTGYILMMEVTGPSLRSDIGILIQFGGIIGMIILPVITWFIRHWVYLELAISIPALGFACSYWIISESPRWLMTHHKRKQFEAVLAKAIRKNKRTVTQDIETILTFSPIKNRNDSSRTMTFVDLVRTPEMRKRIFNLAIIWIVNAFVYYAFTYNTNDLGGNSFVNFFLTGAVELPGFVAMYIAARKLGRRTSILGGMALVALFCLAIIPVPNELSWLIITFTMIGKLFISATFGMLYLYTAEIFPTVIRNMSFGTCSAFARIGSITAPFQRELGKATAAFVPNALNGILAMGAGLLVIFLPETRDKKIPDTVEEIECFCDDVDEKEYFVMDNFVGHLRTPKKVHDDNNYVYTRLS